MEADRREWVPLRQVGWAFLLAWVFCVFYTNAVGDIGGTAHMAAPTLAWSLFSLMLPLAASVASLVVIVVLEPRFGAPTAHRRLVIAAPLLTAASTPLMFLVPANPAVGAALFAVGSVATGIGSALLWVMWGEYYAVLPREKSEALAPASALISAVLVLLVSAMEGWVAVAVAAALPLLSGLCFYLVWTGDAAREEDRLVRQAHRQRAHRPDGAAAPLSGLGRTGFGILMVFAIVSIAGMLYPGRVEGMPLQMILLFSAGMMAVVALMAVSGPRRISLAFLYRWMCPTLVVGFAAVILFGDAGGLVAVAASLGGRFTFCLIAQVYFASYAAAGRATPAQASGLGWLFVHAGDLVGGVTWVLVEPAVSALPNGAVLASVVCIVVLVTATMAVMGDDAAFLRMPASLPDERAGAELAQPASPPAPVAPKVEERATEEAATASTPGNTAPASGDASSAPDPIADLAGAHNLTPREAEVFALLAQGRSIPYIRDELIISRETAATHAKHIYAKLGVHSRQELIDLVHG